MLGIILLSSCSNSRKLNISTMETTLFFLDTNIDDFLSKYPTLKRELPSLCDCGNLLNNLKPYMTKRMVGIHASGCSCGIPFVTISIPRTNLAKTQLENIFFMPSTAPLCI